MANTQTMSAAMKTKFIGPIRENIYSNRILLEGLRNRGADGKSDVPQGTVPFKGIVAEAEGIDFVGNEFRIPLHTGRNAGIGARAENARLMQPGNEQFKFISDPMRYNYGLFNITGQLMKASESNEGAFARALSVEMKGVTESVKRDVNIQAYGDGTGRLATLTTAPAAATTFVVDSTVWLEPGDIVDILTYAGPTYKANARVITAVDRSTRTITVNAAVTAAINDIVVRASSDSTSGVPNNSLNQVTNGLANIVRSTGILHTLDPATNGFWKSTEINAAGAVLGDIHLRQLTDSIGMESGDEANLVLITTRGIRSRYANQLTAMKRFNDASSVTLRGGFKAILFDEKPLVVDDHCPSGIVYALNTPALFWSQMSDWEWLEEDGKVLKWENGYDRYTAVLFKYCNLGTTARNRQGRIYGADDDVR